MSSDAAVYMHSFSNPHNKCRHSGTDVFTNTPLSPTCGARYPCRGPVRPTGTPPRSGRPAPSLLHGLNRNALHRPLGLSPPVTTATQVTASTRKTGATDAAALVIAALRNGAGRAAATVHALLAPCIPPAGRLEPSRGGGVGQVWTRDQ